MKLTICGTDISEFKIHLPAEAAPAEKTAAEFLQRVIKTACGVELPVCSEETAHAIVIGGQPCCDEIRYDGYQIKSDEGNLYLSGNLLRGTLYASYGFAERYLGYRSFAMDTELIPQEGEVNVPQGVLIIDNPVFELRMNDWIGYTHYPENASRARINGMIDHPDALTDRYGGGIVSLGGCHTMEELCPPEIYFEEHPEYYSLWEGKRIPGGNGFKEICGQLCLSNPDVVKIVTDNVLKKLRAHPNARMIDVSQNDNVRYCQCPKCAAIDEEEGSPSGLMLRFVNAVAEEVEKEFPNVLVQTFAYTYTRKAPKITRPRHNVIIRYCTIEACFRHPLNDPNCSMNAGVYETELREWQQLTDKVSVWDYVTNYRSYVSPFPNLSVLRPNARLFAECNAIHLFEEDTPNTWAGIYGDLKAYLIGKLMWNPYMSEETYQNHMDEFLQTYYGPGWGKIKEYIALEEEATADTHMNCFEDVDISAAFECRYPSIGEYMAGEYLPKAYQAINPDNILNGLMARLGEATALWDAALEMAETDLQRMHIERSRLALTYLELFCTTHDAKTMTDEEKTAYEAAVERYLADKEKYGFHYNIWTQRYNNR